MPGRSFSQLYYFVVTQTNQIEANRFNVPTKRGK